jgi:hypothetical protein
MILAKIHTPTIYVLLAGLASLSIAQEPAAPTGQQLLVLRNGQALEGSVSRSGDIYHVALSGGEIRIKAADVELVCRDLEEAYQRKRAVIPVGSLRERLDLAQWCERHKLYDHAAAELADAAAVAPGNPMVNFLRRRVETTLEPLPDPPKSESSRDTALSNAELDRMIRNLPHKTVEDFTRSVQPLLINNCTLSGCHGPQSKNGLCLQRPAADQPTGRRSTQRNLNSVLQYVDRDNPLASRILTVPTAPHGTAKTAIFSEHQITQYKRLVDWVLQLGPADTSNPPEITTNTAPTTAEIQAVFQAPAAKSAKADPSADSESPKRKVKRGATPPEFTPKDSFDPEIFNRRYIKPAKSDSSGD